jgi:hypothetical protein
MDATRTGAGTPRGIVTGPDGTVYAYTGPIGEPARYEGHPTRTGRAYIMHSPTGRRFRVRLPKGVHAPRTPDNTDTIDLVLQAAITLHQLTYPDDERWFD